MIRRSNRSIRAAVVALLVLVTGALAGAIPAGAAARPTAPPASGSWATVHSQVGGVAALGHYRRTGDRVRLIGSLFDTADDGRAVRLDVRPFGGCCFRVVRNLRGGGTGVRVDVTVTAKEHLAVREITYHDRRMRVGRWVQLF